MTVEYSVLADFKEIPLINGEHLNSYIANIDSEGNAESLRQLAISLEYDISWESLSFIYRFAIQEDSTYTNLYHSYAVSALVAITDASIEKRFQDAKDICIAAQKMVDIAIKQLQPIKQPLKETNKPDTIADLYFCSGQLYYYLTGKHESKDSNLSLTKQALQQYQQAIIYQPNHSMAQ